MWGLSALIFCWIIGAVAIFAHLTKRIAAAQLFFALLFCRTHVHIFSVLSVSIESQANRHNILERTDDTEHGDASVLQFDGPELLEGVLLSSLGVLIVEARYD